MLTHCEQANFKVVYLEDFIQAIKNFYEKENAKLTCDQILNGELDDTFNFIRVLQNEKNTEELKRIFHNNVNFDNGFIAPLHKFFNDEVVNEANGVDGIHVIDQENAEIVYTYFNYEPFAKKFSLGDCAYPMAKCLASGNRHPDRDKIKEFVKNFKDRNGFEPSNRTIAERLSMSLTIVNEVLG